MFKVIHMDNLPTGENFFTCFETEEAADQYLDELATQYIQNGYEAKNIPAQQNIMFNDPQMLKVTRKHNVYNPNDPSNIIVYALLPQQEGEYILITRNKMKEFSDMEDETNYCFETSTEDIGIIYENLQAKGYRLVASSNCLLCCKSETDTFISEVYIINY